MIDLLPLIHDIAQGLSEQGAAAGLRAFEPHVEEALFGVERDVGIDDQAGVGGVSGIAPGLDERVKGIGGFGF